MTDAPRCPQCRTEVQPTWDWCEACGFDPEGLRPVGTAPVGPAPAPPPDAPGRTPTARATAAAPPIGVPTPVAPPQTASPGAVPGPAAPGAPPPSWQAPGTGTPGPPPPVPAWGSPGAEPGWVPPPPPPGPVRKSIGYKVAIGVLAAVILLVLVPLMAVVFLGDAAEPRFEPVGSRIDSGGAGSEPRFDPATGEFEDGIGNRYELDQRGLATDDVEQLGDGWVRFTHPEDRFSIELPSVPAEMAAQGTSFLVDEVEETTWIARDGVGDMVSVSWRPVGDADRAALERDPDLVMDQVVEGTGLSMNVTFENVQDLEVDGRAARRATIAASTIGAPADVVVIWVADGEGLLNIQAVGASSGDPAERALGSLTFG